MATAKSNVINLPTSTKPKPAAAAAGPSLLSQIIVGVVVGVIVLEVSDRQRRRR